MHGTAKPRRFGRRLNDEVITSAECWYQPEEEAWLNHCSRAVVWWTDWIDPWEAVSWPSNRNPPERLVP